MKKENKNFLYSSGYQILLYLIPLISTPYISRTLGVENVGIYSYTYSIVYYFMLASMLGINNYATRTLSKLIENKKEFNKKFNSIYFLQLILVCIFSIIYIIFTTLYKYEYTDIMKIQFIYLISVAFDINWLFFSLEKFKITVSRNAIIKLLSLILILLFIKTKNDLWKYTLIMSGSTLLSQLFLWPFAIKEVRFQKVEFKNILANLKPCLILFIPVISYSIYRVMDKTMLGIFSSNFELGNYEMAEKIINIPISIVTALGTVMLPNMSKKTERQIKENIIDTFELSYFIIIPVIIGLLIVADDFSLAFFGAEYTKSGSLLKILSITLLFSATSNVIRNCYLIPTGKDKIYVISTSIAAGVNLICNLIFIRMYGAYGACIGTILAEGIVMFYQFIKSINVLNVKKIFLLIMKYLLKSLIMGLLIMIIGHFVNNIIIKLIVQILVAVLIYFILNYKYLVHGFLGK